MKREFERITSVIIKDARNAPSWLATGPFESVAVFEYRIDRLTKLYFEGRFQQDKSWRLLNNLIINVDKPMKAKES